MPAPPARRPRDVVYAPDRGCAYAPRCVTCPWAVCIKQLPTAERGEFRAALKIVLSYAAVE